MQYVSRYDQPRGSERVLVTRDGATRSTLQTGAFGKVAGQAIVRATGRDVVFIDAGVAGGTLSGWAAATSPWRQKLVSSIRAAGGADLVMLQAGWNDAAGGSIKSREGQLALYQSLIGSIRTEAAIPNVPVVLGACQNLHGGVLQFQGQLALQRLAELDAVGRIADVAYGFSTYDLATYDGTHQSEQGQLLSGQRFAEVAIARLAGQPLPHGPRGVLARRFTDTVTQVQLNVAGEGDYIPSSGIDGFFVQDAAGLSAATAAARIDARTIEVTHRPLAGGTIRYALDSALGLPGCVRDTSITARPMEPMLLRIS